MFLPPELMTRILSFLPFKDIVICSAVSRYFLELVRTSAILQYAIELGLSGFVDSGRENLTTIERLALLRGREDAWSTLSWRYASKIPVGKKYIFYELCGELFAGSYRSQNDLPYGPRTFDMIDIFHLESTTDAQPMKKIALGSRFCNFSVDPGQDLLLLVEEPPNTPNTWVMHLKTLSDISGHPNATQTIVEVPVAHEKWPTVTQDNSPGAVETQILGNFILFCQRRGPGLSGSMSVFDWTTGTMTLLIYPMLGDWCGALISEKHLLLSQRPGFRSQPCLELYDIRPRSKWYAPRITFLLPFGSDERWRTKACYGPASYSCTDAAFPKSLRPFVPTRHPLLLAFRFIHPSDAGDPADPSLTLDMFLIPSKLQNYGQATDVIDWEEWGPQCTRWFRAALPNKWRRNIQGYRAVLPERNIVLDFSPNYPPGNGDPWVTQSSHIPSDFMGNKGIVSSLPYRTLHSRQPFESKYVMLGNQLVCVEIDPHERGLAKSFRVLKFEPDI